MAIVKKCPKCGSMQEGDGKFCSSCGCNLNINQNKLFDRINDKLNVSSLIFSFIIFGIFLFVGTVFWSIFLSSGSIGFTTYLLLTVVFSVLFSTIFIGYTACRDESYIVPNFAVFTASIFALLLCGAGLVFSFVMGFSSALSSIFSPVDSTSSYTGNYNTYYADSGNRLLSTPSFNFGIYIILFIILIPVAAYLGVFIGFKLNKYLS